MVGGEVGKEVTKVKFVIPTPNSGEQLEFVKCDYLRIVTKVGRRGGKTFGLAIRALCAFLGVCKQCLGVGCSFCDNTGRVKRKRYLYAAPTAEQVSKFWFEVCSALQSGIDAGVFKKDETEKFIEVPGTEIRIKAKTAWNANTLRGDYGDEVALEEYQLWNEDAWVEVVQPMLLDNNGTAVFVFTPPSLRNMGASKAKDPRHATKMFKKYQEDKTGRWRTFHWTSYENPSLNQDALKELKETWDGSMDSYRREIMAQDDEVENSWLVCAKFNEELCKIPRFEIPKTWRLDSSHDFGTANPAAIFLAQVILPLPQGTPNYLRYGDYVLFREYAPGGGSTAQHVEQFRQITDGYKVRLSLGGNVTTEDEIRQGYGAAGYPIAAPPLSRVNAQLDKMIAVFETNKLYVFDDCYGVLAQMAACMWELDDQNKPINKIKDEKKYHFIACLRYWASSVHVEVPVKDLKQPKVRVW